MSRLLALALTAAFALPLPTAITPALANHSCEPGQPNCNPGHGSGQSHKTPWPEIACRVPGHASDKADDLRFTNIGDVLIPGGTQIFWQVKLTGERGNFLLKRDLPVGAEIDDADVLNAVLPGKIRCVSRLG